MSIKDVLKKKGPVRIDDTAYTFAFFLNSITASKKIGLLVLPRVEDPERLAAVS